MNELIEGCDVTITNLHGAQIAAMTTYGHHKIKLRFHIWRDGAHHAVCIQLQPGMTQEDLAQALDHPVCWKISEPAPAARPRPIAASEDF